MAFKQYTPYVSQTQTAREQTPTTPSGHYSAYSSPSLQLCIHLSLRLPHMKYTPYKHGTITAMILSAFIKLCLVFEVITLCTKSEVQQAYTYISLIPHVRGKQMLKNLAIGGNHDQGEQILFALVFHPPFIYECLNVRQFSPNHTIYMLFHFHQFTDS